MLRSSNVFINNFFKKLDAKYGDLRYYRLCSPEIFSEQERLRGRQLVKTALYHIRLGLKTGSIHSPSLDDTILVGLFAGPEHVEEIFNLGGFPTFWDGSDRGLRYKVIKALSRLVLPDHSDLIKKFQLLLEGVDYSGTDDEDDVAFDDEVQRTPDDLRSYDLKEFQEVLTRVESFCTSAQL